MPATPTITVSIRLPADGTYEKLRDEAKAKGLSLNAYLVQKLSS